MIFSEFLAEYDGEVEVEVKKITEDGIKDVITFKNTESESIAETVLKAKVGKYKIGVTDKVPAKGKLIVLIVDMQSDSGTTSDPTNSSGDP